MKIRKNNYHKAMTLDPRAGSTRRQAYYKGKYKREVFYVTLSVIVLIIASGGLTN